MDSRGGLIRRAGVTYRRPGQRSGGHHGAGKVRIAIGERHLLHLQPSLSAQICVCTVAVRSWCWRSVKVLALATFHEQHRRDEECHFEMSLFAKALTMTVSKAGAPVALVTGGNKGIGLETVTRLVAAGYCVYLAARNPSLGKAAADTVGATFVELDVTSDESVRLAADLVERTDGRLDVLVNNAGVSGPLGDARDYTPGDAADVFRTNVVGYVRMIHAFLPLLERADAARIVNVSSGLGSFGLFNDDSRMESRFGSPLYAASKAAINMLTARYARLLPNIRINVADPGLTATDLSGGQGQSPRDGTDAIIAYALGETGAATGTYRDRHGDLPW